MSYDDHNHYYFCQKHMVSTAGDAPGFCRVCRDIEPELARLRTAVNATHGKIAALEATLREVLHEAPAHAGMHRVVR